MNDAERLKASKQQILNYLSTQYPKWRLTSILSIQKILNNIDNFYSDIVDLVKQPDDESGKHTIRREIVLGLTLQAISEVIQYIEELFSMLKCAQDLPWFIRNLITYKASKVTNFIRTFEIEVQNICKHFLVPYIPSKLDWVNEDSFNDYISSLELFSSYLTNILTFYKKFEFLNNQYKHGLNIIFRLYDLQNISIEPEYSDVNDGVPIFIWDNLETKKVFNEPHRFSGSAALFMNDDIQPHSSALHKEDNLLRFTIPTENVRIQDIVDISKKINILYNCLRHNLIEVCKMDNAKELTCAFPTGNINEMRGIGFPLS